MDAVSVLYNASKLLGDLAGKLQGNQKELIEVLMARIDLAKDQVESVARERDDLKQQVTDLTARVKELEEKLAYREVSEEFTYGKLNGLLYKKNPDGSEDGPYCPQDQMRMMRVLGRSFRCPKCQATGIH
jgi:hypothetical protein